MDGRPSKSKRSRSRVIARATRWRSNILAASVLSQKFTIKFSRHSGQAGDSWRDPESRISTTYGCPKFTNEVQHFLYKVLRWDKNMNSFRWNNVARLPGIAKPGKQSAKSRQLWIARHRL